ncbi:MAG: T9SS type A sorting domain-containing protein [Ignavibacteria bacterium]|nr:T9SS type A sorting domain-containing protein [Ignavibacteria bacterium]
MKNLLSAVLKNLQNLIVRNQLTVGLFSILVMLFAVDGSGQTVAQVDRMGLVPGHTVTTPPSAKPAVARFIIGQAFAGRSDRGTFGFLPLTAPNINSVNEESVRSANAVVTAWPMPASDAVTVTIIPQKKPGRYVVVSPDGRQIATGIVEPETSTISFSVSQIPSGIYSLVLYLHASVATVPVSVVR